MFFQFGNLMNMHIYLKRVNDYYKEEIDHVLLHENVEFF